MSSSSRAPSNAVDNIVDCRSFNLLAHTYHDFQPWLKIDLQAMHDVIKVTIVNRFDCCGTYLEFFHIFIVQKNSIGIEHKFHNLDRLLSFPAFSWFINAGESLKTPLLRALRIQTIYEIQVQNYQEMRQGSRFFVFFFFFVLLCYFFPHILQTCNAWLWYFALNIFWLIFFFSNHDTRVQLSKTSTWDQG